MTTPRRFPRGVTPQRIRVLTLAANGHTTEQIAHRLNLSINTVNGHFRGVFAALGARDRTHAVVLAIRAGYVNPAQVEPAPGVGAAA
jgi:DNA-binding NarL/FixJ family response regulator